MVEFSLRKGARIRKCIFNSLYLRGGYLIQALIKMRGGGEIGGLARFQLHTGSIAPHVETKWRTRESILTSLEGCEC